jgi:hypothetical protein
LVLRTKTEKQIRKTFDIHHAFFCRLCSIEVGREFNEEALRKGINTFFNNLEQNTQSSIIQEKKKFFDLNPNDDKKHHYVKTVIDDRQKGEWSEAEVFSDNHTDIELGLEVSNYFLDSNNSIKRRIFTGDNIEKSAFAAATMSDERKEEYKSFQLAFTQAGTLSFLLFLLGYYNYWLFLNKKDIRFLATLGNHESLDILARDFTECKNKPKFNYWDEIDRPIGEVFSLYYRFFIPIHITILKKDNSLSSYNHSGGVGPMSVISQNTIRQIIRAKVACVNNQKSALTFFKDLPFITDDFKKEIFNGYLKNLAGRDEFTRDPLDMWCDFMGDVLSNQFVSETESAIFIEGPRPGCNKNFLKLLLYNQFFIRDFLSRVDFSSDEILKATRNITYYFGHQHNAYSVLPYMNRGNNLEKIEIDIEDPDANDCFKLIFLPPEHRINDFGILLDNKEIRSKEIECSESIKTDFSNLRKDIPFWSLEEKQQKQEQEKEEYLRSIVYASLIISLQVFALIYAKKNNIHFDKKLYGFFVLPFAYFLYKSFIFYR